MYTADGSHSILRECCSSRLLREVCDFPGGGLEHDESVKQCGEREVKEETGYEIEVNGFYGVYLEKSDTTDLPVIVYLLDGEINGQGEADNHFDGEIRDHGFLDEEELQQRKLRKDNRTQMLKVIRNREPLPVERLKDLR